MRFAVKTAPQHTTWSDMLAVWQHADDIDLFESAWNFDHFYPIFSDWKGPCLEAWTMLAAMAQATRRIRIGVLVTGNVYRHPAVLANMAATVDVVSNGRLELGLGAGWNQQECDAYGIELPGLRDRFDMFDEACEVIVGLLSNETTSFEGKHYRLTEARCEPKPVQRPHPPLCIGGGGERRTLRTVARFAQHWNVPGGGIDVFQHKRAVLAEHCAAIGRDPGTITTSTHVRFDPSMGASALADEAARWDEAGLDLAIVTLAPPHRHDTLDDLASALAPLAR
jgi:F420-dependent oxidoreductase-like protein